MIIALASCRLLPASQELLLMTDKSCAGMIGYIEKAGIIESLAMQEYESFIDRSPPQMVRKYRLAKRFLQCKLASCQCQCRCLSLI